MTGLPDGLDLAAGDNPEHIAAAAIVVAKHATSAADHCELAEMIGVPVVSPEPPAPPKPKRKNRCRKCGYLRTAPGHKLKCGGKA